MTAWSQIHADGGVASQKFVDDERVFLGFVTGIMECMNATVLMVLLVLVNGLMELFHVSKLRRNTVDLKNINITDLNPIFKKLEIFLSLPKSLLGPYFRSQVTKYQFSF